MGAGMTVSEMVTSDSSLWHTRKSQFRLIHTDDPSPRSVQIAGADPAMLADAASRNVELGAQIIDINMGCPAKKVCKKAAGSALLRDEKLVEDILVSVVKSVSVPVTLKIRLGWDRDNKNATTIARIAEDAGIQALAVHGRTRACRFIGDVDYEAIALVKQAVGIPVIANGDITDVASAAKVLEKTKADGLMIGRGAQGNPWIFKHIQHYLDTGKHTPSPPLEEFRQVVLDHVAALHLFYGDYLGPRIARKHVAWYCHNRTGFDLFRKTFNQLAEPHSQLSLLDGFFDELLELEGYAA
jgi:tRNA-dihydrouridine synthase B